MQVDDFLQFLGGDAEVEGVAGVDFHEGPVPQRRERRDRRNLSRAMVETRPAPDVAQRIAGDRIGQERKLAAKAFERRLCAALRSASACTLLTSLQAIGSGWLRERRCRVLDQHQKAGGSRLLRRRSTRFRHGFLLV